MDAIDILNYIETEVNFDEFIVYFIDLHIMDNSVVGFYKTQSIKYDNIHGEKESYLFPTTFVFNNGKIETSMVLGSVKRNFQIPRNDSINYAREVETNLVTSGVGRHVYKLLIAKQRLDDIDNEEVDSMINIKSFMHVISGLDDTGFPFMRITNNKAIV